jgi:hypothetical protein
LKRCVEHHGIHGSSASIRQCAVAEPLRRASDADREVEEALSEVVRKYRPTATVSGLPSSFVSTAITDAAK